MTIKFIKIKTSFTILACVLCLMMAGVVKAQVKFYTLVSEQTISHDQTFQVQYVIEGAKKVQQFKTPAYADFQTEDVFEIPNTPTIDSKTLQLTEAYSRILVLSPKKSGKLLVPGATAIIDGKFMRSNTVSITVKQTGLSSLSYSPFEEEEKVEDESELHAGDNIDVKIRENLFLQAKLSKKSCYVGESIMAIYKACSRLNASSQVVKRPSLTGFSVVEMVDSYDNKPEIEKINGKSFFTHLIRKVQLFPLQSGTYELDGAEVESVIHFIKINDANRDNEKQELLLERATDSTFNALDYKTLLKSPTVSVEVKPLPEAGQPSSFTGAVGRFSMNVTVLNKNIEQGEVARIQVTINGQGNFPLITAPQINWPRSVESLGTSVKEEVNKYVHPLHGRKIFEYSLDAKDTGKIVIPSIEFSYFDPGKRSYKTLYSDSISIQVLEAAYQEDPLKVTNLQKRNPAFPLHWLWFGLIVLAILGSIIYQVIHLRKSKTVNEPADRILRFEEPVIRKVTPDYFGKARYALLQGNKELFYTEVESAIWTAIEHEYGLAPSDLNKQKLLLLLKQNNVSEGVIHELIYLLNECEWALYTPEHTATDMHQTLQKASELLRQLNRL